MLHSTGEDHGGGPQETSLAKKTSTLCLVVGRAARRLTSVRTARRSFSTRFRRLTAPRASTATDFKLVFVSFHLAHPARLIFDRAGGWHLNVAPAASQCENGLFRKKGKGSPYGPDVLEGSLHPLVVKHLSWFSVWFPFNPRSGIQEVYL